ncbi:hypothetical protein WMY93_002233 [Mugilogobius chulae]|uniref:Uncharacterized protein n=1 Tax=Mugilogobius chulae TaxID=88201 RepID=A0AAW0Q3X7_9GOBI
MAGANQPRPHLQPTFQFSPKLSSKHFKSSPKSEKPYNRPKRFWTRDERQARALKLPFSNDLIINLPVDEFNDLLSDYQLDEYQLNLIRTSGAAGRTKSPRRTAENAKWTRFKGWRRTLRDEEGRPLDVQEYMLSFENDGNVEVVSRRRSGKEKSRRKQKGKK